MFTICRNTAKQLTALGIVLRCSFKPMRSFIRNLYYVHLLRSWKYWLKVDFILPIIYFLGEYWWTLATIWNHLSFSYFYCIFATVFITNVCGKGHKSYAQSKFKVVISSAVCGIGISVSISLCSKRFNQWPSMGTFGSQNPSLEGLILKDLPTELEGKSQAALLVVLCWNLTPIHPRRTCHHSSWSSTWRVTVVTFSRTTLSY